MENLFICENITKSYGEGEKKTMVLNQVSITVQEGEFISIMGPSGSGKSTLMYIMGGMEKSDGGNVLFDGKNLSVLTEKELAGIRRTKMGFVFQQPGMLKNLDVLSNIVLPSVRSSPKHVKSTLKRGKALMEKAGISGLEEREISQVSGGQLQRAGICRALINSPRMVFADEPTGALNRKAAGEIMDLFRKINQEGTAMVLVTHDAWAAAQSGRVLFLVDGRIAGELKLSEYNGSGLKSRMEKVEYEMRKAGI